MMTAQTNRTRATLIVSPNWIGDAVMSMPAVQRFRATHPDTELIVLAKSRVAALWAMHPAPDRIVELKPGRDGMDSAIGELRARDIAEARVLPHSFRSAWIPFRAGIPRRIGRGGGLRHLLLNEPIRQARRTGRTHQRFEAMDLLSVAGPGDAEEGPALEVPVGAAQSVLEQYGIRTPFLSVMPGAARGASKQWPAASFAEAVGMLCEAFRLRALVLGAEADAPVGRMVAEGVGSNAVNLCGQTTLPEWAALLADSRVALTNDSGGMHLAAALGTPTVAVFGCTDPEVTGPVGPACAIVRGQGPSRRDIPRNSRKAAKILADISPKAVYDAAVAWLKNSAADREAVSIDGGATHD